MVAVLLALSIPAVLWLHPFGSQVVFAQTSSFTAQSVSSQFMTEFSLGPNSLPNAISADSAGDLWFTMAHGYAVAELMPTNGTVRVFVVPDQNGTLVSWGIARDPTGKVWLTDETCNCIRSLDPVTGAFTTYPLPTPDSIPYALAIDASGNVWFTELGVAKIGEITSGGTLKEYPIPAQNPSLVGPAGILVRNGVVWFDEVYDNKIASFADGTFRQYQLNESAPTGLAMDPFGDLWTTLHGGSTILELDPHNNSTTVISTSIIGVQETLPYFIQVDSAGNIWFNEHYGNAIAKFDPSTSTLVEYEIPTRVQSLGNISGALTMTLDASGRPWFTEFYSGKIGTVNITAPIQTSVAVVNSTRDTSRLVARLQVISTQSTLLSASSPNPGVTFSFSQPSGVGSYLSTLTVSSLPSGSFSLTISAITPDVVCSVTLQSP